MKSNLDVMYKNNPVLEKEGIEFIVSEKISFTVRRWMGLHSFEVKKKLAHKHSPFVRQIEAGTLSEEKSKEIIISLFVDTCVVSWKGVEIDGVEKEFNRDDCIKLFTSLPDLCDSLLAYASDTKNYREELGNS